MRALLLFIGGTVVVAAIAISMTLNALFGMSLGQTELKQFLFAGVSVVADLWKALGPVFVQPLLSRRRVLAAGAGSIAWIACALYSMSSALGVVAQDRGTLTGGRETLRASYETTSAELDRAEGKRGQLSSTRSVRELEAVIEVALSQPVRVQERVRGTVASLSDHCAKMDARTVDACAAVAALRQELANAVEARDLDERIAGLKRSVIELRDRGALLATDAQAELISRLSRGWLSARDLGQGIVVLVVAVLELVSAFGPVVLTAYAHATTNVAHVAVGRDAAREDEAGRAMSRAATPPVAVGSALDFLAECVEPSADAAGITLDRMTRAYVDWCERKGCLPKAEPEFIIDLDEVRRRHGLENEIRKAGGQYFGIILSRDNKILTAYGTVLA